MDLSLDIARTSGRAKARVEGEVVKRLTGADLALLELNRGVKAPQLKRLRDSHHSLARLIAAGQPGTEIALITGYSQSRISILKGDPAFQELVAHYSAQNESATAEAFADAQQKLSAVNRDALEELHDRILDEPHAILTDELLDIVKVTSDRTGNGPSAKNTNVNINLDLATRVANGRARAESIVRGPPGLPLAIEGSALPAAAPNAALPSAAKGGTRE